MSLQIANTNIWGTLMSDADWSLTLVDELHRLAGAAMRNERAGHTLQPSDLVNEAFIVLRRQHNLDIAERSNFLAAAATTIRRILVDYARRKKAEKRGGPDAKKANLTVSMMGVGDEVDVIAIHDALNVLAEESERAAQVVEMRFFGGLTNEEISAQLKISVRTVNNDWKFAKVWLYRQMGGESDSAQ